MALIIFILIEFRFFNKIITTIKTKSFTVPTILKCLFVRKPQSTWGTRK